MNKFKFSLSEQFGPTNFIEQKQEIKLTKPDVLSSL